MTNNKILFCEKSKEIHKNKYDYSLVEYINNKTKVKIICPIHGIFEQKPDAHLYCGCKYCQESRGERKIRTILKKLKINYIMQKKFSDCKNKRELPFDFYLPDFNICIEYDGIQHFKSIEYFGGINGFEQTVNNDKIKTNYCKENNIQLIRIKYNENIEEKFKFLTPE